MDTSVVIANALVSRRLNYCNSVFLSLSSRNATRLYRKKVSLASTIKTMETTLSKNCFPTTVDFRFNISSSRNPVLGHSWMRAVGKCKTEMTGIIG